MKRPTNVFLVLPMILFLALGMAMPGCGVSQEDRCMDGYYYNKAWNTCELLPDAALPDATPTDAGPEADGEITDGGSTDGGSESGIGDFCTESAQCTKAADFCAVNPITTEGYCTFNNCTNGSCPAGWMCCDCTFQGAGDIFCAPADDDQIKQFCTCENVP